MTPPELKVVWEKDFTPGFRPRVFRNWIALNWKKEFWVIEAATGKVRLKRTLQSDLADLTYNTHLIQPDLNLVVACSFYNGTADYECFDILSGKSRWKQRFSQVYLCTGEVLWTLEKHKDYRGEDTVARSIKTGRELWRKSGATKMTPGDRCLFTWSGRTLTCWVGEKDPRLKELKEQKAGATKAVAQTHKAAPELGRFGDLFVSATPESKVKFFTVGQILKVLRKHFPEVNVTIHNEIEIYDEYGRLLGTMDFKDGRGSYLPKGTRKLTDETRVTGFHLEATVEPNVHNIVTSGLKISKSGWTGDYDD